MKQILDITKALSDETRLRVLLSVQAKPLCVCQIVELFQLSGATISKHLSILRNAGLVQSEKRGKWVYYGPVEKDACCEPAKGAIAWLTKSLCCDKQLEQDQKRLKQILKIDPEELCRRQCKN